MEPLYNIKTTTRQLNCIDLTYLRQITKSNPGVITKMMVLYLRQIPPLLLSLRKGYTDQDCKVVFAAAHQLIPSFAIMGIDREFEAISKRVQKIASAGLITPEMHVMIMQLEEVCTIACTEVLAELNAIRVQ